MSKLIDSLKERQLGKVALYPPTLPSMDVGEIVAHIDFTEGYNYELFAKFSIRVICGKDELNKVKSLVRRAMVEEIFGEFRAPIMKIYGELLRMDVKAALSELQELERLMYEETK